MDSGMMAERKHTFQAGNTGSTPVGDTGGCSNLAGKRETEQDKAGQKGRPASPPPHHGDAGRAKPNRLSAIAARYPSRVAEVPNGCHVWLSGNGKIPKLPYGQIRANGKCYQAHRVAYILEFGPIDDGLVIDHACRNTRCVNPQHLEPVTIGENVRRGLKGRLTTHCKRGHELSGRNLVPNRFGRRMCRVCHNMRQRSALSSRSEGGR